MSRTYVERNNLSECVHCLKLCNVDVYEEDGVNHIDWKNHKCAGKTQAKSEIVPKRIKK
jgi:uncharacterized protein YraI